MNLHDEHDGHVAPAGGSQRARIGLDRETEQWIKQLRITDPADKPDQVRT